MKTPILQKNTRSWECILFLSNKASRRDIFVATHVLVTLVSY